MGPSHNGVWALLLAVAVGGASAALSCGTAGGPSEFDVGGDAATQPPTEAGPIFHDDFSKPIFADGATPNAPKVFASTSTDGGPCLFEPEMGSLFPTNWLRPRFRFNPAKGENLYEIKMVVPHETSPLVIYTTKSGYILDKAIWTTMTAVGTGTVHVTIRGAVVDAGGNLTAGPFKGTEGDIELAPVDATGSVLYWTTSSGTVLKGFAIGAETVQSVIQPAAAGTKCVACHTSTPDGLYAGLTASSDPGDGSGPAYVALRSVDGQSTEPPFLTATARSLLARTNQHAPTFSKAHWSSGDRIALTMFNQAARTDIVWTDLETSSMVDGTGWGVLKRNGDTRSAASAAFSHDGTKVAYVSTAAAADAGVILKDGLIWTVPFNGRAGGTAVPLAGASDATFNQYYPTFSADDKLVAFNRVPTGQTSYNNAAAEVFVLPAAGGTATRLVANDPPACLTGVKSPGITNSWPKWSPEVKSANGSSYYFLVFSSTRNAATKGPQLYVAAVVVTGSTVKTYAALNLWNQPELENNHTPAWDVFQFPGPR